MRKQLCALGSALLLAGCSTAPSYNYEALSAIPPMDHDTAVAEMNRVGIPLYKTASEVPQELINKYKRLLSGTNLVNMPDSFIANLLAGSPRLQLQTQIEN